MNAFLLAAGVLSIAIGLVHSILGEVLIFNKLRAGSIVPTQSREPLRERHTRILWATWHLASIFGWVIGAILVKLASLSGAEIDLMVSFIAVSMLMSGLLVLIATKAKHPGWIGLLSIAMLCWLA